MVEMAVFGLDAVFDGQQALTILGGDAKHAREPAPEHGSGSTQSHRCGYAHNVASADGGRQRGG